MLKTLETMQNEANAWFSVIFPTSIAYLFTFTNFGKEVFIFTMPLLLVITSKSCITWHSI